MIVKYVNEHANYDILFSIEFDVSGRTEKMKIQQYITTLSSAVLQGCLSSTFTFNERFMMATTMIEERCLAMIPTNMDFYAQVNL